MAERRLNSFKAGIGRRDHTSKRRQETVRIRKQLREKKLMSKRRRRGDALGLVGSGATKIATDDAAAEAHPPGHMEKLATDSEALAKVVECMRSARESKDRTGALKTLRRVLSLTEDPPLDGILSLGAVPVLLRFLESHTSTEEQKLEACWCFTNIASGTHRQTEHALEAAPHLISFLQSSSPVFQEQAAWALGNIAADDEWRKRLHANGTIPPMAALLGSKRVEVLRTATWALTNLAQGRGTPAAPFVRAAGSRIVAMLGHDDEAVVTEVTWMLSYLTAREETAVNELLRLGLSKTLLDSFMSKVKALFTSDGGDLSVITPYVRCLGNLLSGPDAWASAVLARKDFLQFFLRIVSVAAAESAGTSRGGVRVHRTLTKEICWVLSNIAGGIPAHCRLIVDAGFVPPLCTLLERSDFDVKREVAHVLFNVASQNPKVYLPPLAARGMISRMISMIGADDVSMIALGVRFAKLVLATLPDGQKRVESANGIELLENLQYRSVPPGLCREAKALLDRYFDEDYGADDDDDGGACVDFSRGFGNDDATAHKVSAFGARSNASGGRGRGAHLTRPAWAARAQDGGAQKTLMDFGFGATRK